MEDNAPLRTGGTSYSTPEDGSPITISTRKKKKKKTEEKTPRGFHPSQTSLLIEYFEADKTEREAHSRPSVRVPVTPSSRRKSGSTSDDIQINHTSQSFRNPSYTRRIPLGTGSRNEALESRESSLPAVAGDPGLSELPPGAVNTSSPITDPICLNHSEVSRPFHPRSYDFHTPSHTTPTSLRSQFQALQSIKKPRPGGLAFDSPSESGVTQRGLHNVETRSSIRPPSGLTSEDEDVSQASHIAVVGDGSCSPASINNPGLLAAVEAAIQRLILPELEALKREQQEDCERTRTASKKGRIAQKTPKKVQNAQKKGAHRRTYVAKPRLLTPKPDSFKALVPDRYIVASDCGLDLIHTVLDGTAPDSLVVRGCLGHGSLGIVEEVQISRLHPFVRKKVPLPYSQRETRQKIIQDEAKVLEELCHPHIVQILGSYEDSTYKNKHFYCLLMSPVGDSDLKSFLEEVGTRGPTTAENDWLFNWFPCLSSALAYMHSQGVRHQDIKPSNIIHRGSQVFFTDFSSSARFKIDQTTSTENPARNSAMYAAPEAVEAMQEDGTLNRHGRGSDIFSLGCVFSEMWTVFTDANKEGTSVQSYHHFLATSFPDSLDQTSGENATGVPGRLLYSRTTERIGMWFRKQVSNSPIFDHIIAPMISLPRETRPDAHGVLLALSEYEGRVFTGCDHCIRSFSACPCHCFGLSDPNRHSVEG